MRAPQRDLNCRVVRRSPIISFPDILGPWIAILSSPGLSVKSTGHQDLELWVCGGILWPLSGTHCLGQE